MQSSKLFEILNILSGKQKKDLKSFALLSTNHLSLREEEVLNKLLGSKKLNSIVGEDEIIDSILHDEEKLNWNKIKNRFLKVIEHYLVLEKVRDHSAFKELVLLSIYSDLNLDKNYRSKSKSLDNKLKDESKLGSWTSFLNYKKMEIEVGRNADIRKYDNSLNEMGTALDAFYIENKLIILCEQFNRVGILNQDSFDSEFLHFINRLDVNSMNKRIKCYFYIIYLLRTDNKKYLDKVNDELSVDISTQNKDFLNTILTYLLNYHVRKINLGHRENAKQYIKIIDKKVELGIFTPKRQISSGQFKNCITISLVAGMNKWAKEFSSEFAGYIQKNKRMQVLNFGEAAILFEEERYNECHDKLTDLVSNDVYFRIAQDKMLLKLMYYKLLANEYKIENFWAMVDRVRKYISTQKLLNAEKKKINQQFLVVLRRLINGRDIALERIKGTIPIIDYLWIKKEVDKIANLPK